MNDYEKALITSCAMAYQFQHRIASALERIAAALEADEAHEPDPARALEWRDHHDPGSGKTLRVFGDPSPDLIAAHLASTGERR